MKYTKESLSKANRTFVWFHYGITDYDVEKVNRCAQGIIDSRSTDSPVPGDIVRYTDKYGVYYGAAHIDEDFGDGTLYLCGHAGTYAECDKDGNMHYSTSGGPWYRIPKDKLSFVGTESRRFWVFGHDGACADGGLDYMVPVNVWEFSENTEPYSTKDHEKFTAFYHPVDPDHQDDYPYSVYSYGNTCRTGFRTMEAFQAWLRTMRAEASGSCVWTYKQEKHHVSPAEYEAIDAPEDVVIMNGLRRCKRTYDDAGHIVHTYIVWYWKDDTMDFDERMRKQNDAIREYEIKGSYRGDHDVNIVALEELRSGKVKPIQVQVFFR